jgi:hypothetical protein
LLYLVRFLAVTCGLQAKVYSFRTGDYIYHTVFEQERLRVDTCELLPWLGWKEYPIQRSFDAFQFVCIHPSTSSSSPTVPTTSLDMSQSSKQKTPQHRHHKNRNMKISDGGIFWNGMKATYPLAVPIENVKLARLCLQRRIMFHGRIDELDSLTRSKHYETIIECTALQNQKSKLLSS